VPGEKRRTPKPFLLDKSDGGGNSWGKKKVKVSAKAGSGKKGPEP